MFVYLIIISLHLFAENFALEKGPDVNYCKFPCGFRRLQVHTICKLKHRCEVSPNCRKFQNLPFSDNEKESIVYTHNKLRNYIALGNGCASVEGMWFDTASSMREIVWDRELEFQAQCWANQCTMKRESCRRKYDGQYVGQNLAWIQQESVIGAIHSFFQECKNISFHKIFNYYAEDGRGDSFTQLVYWNTTQIGCARVTYELPFQSSRRIFFVCNYAWSGNWIGKPVYITGPPASKCPRGTERHIKFKGLCTTDPSKSKIPNICRFAADRNRCIPYLSMVKNVDRLEPRINYCEDKYKCYGEVNTVCRLNHNCLQKSNCALGTQLKQSEKMLILQRHNHYRDLVARGGKGRLKMFNNKTLPPASNMRELVWDVELEFLAQCWANQCILGHDACSIKLDATSVGQNLGYGTKSIPKFITSFFDEHVNVSNASVLAHYVRDKNRTIGHFTQMVYAETTQLGCAKSTFFKMNKMQTFLVCNYAPAGNDPGLPVYLAGPPCTKCPTSCHELYPGLCKTKPSTSKEPNICDSNQPNCKKILENPGLGSSNLYTPWYLMHRKGKKSKTLGVLQKSDGISNKYSFTLMGFVAYIATSNTGDNILQNF
ncbi:hypothetical protein ILUMI_26783, partial [Ignelater luminosus]